MRERDFELAAKVHYSFLQESYTSDFVDISVKGRPFDKVGGDYSSILPLGPDRLMVCMCDVVGHGIAAALLAARVNTFVLSHMSQSRDPCGLIQSLNSYLFERLAGTGIYTTFALALFDFTEKNLLFVGAAHPPLLHFKAASGEVELTASEAIFLGAIDPLAKGCPGTSREIRPGDRVFLYTDGVTEIKNSAGQNYGTKRLSEFVRKNCALTNDDFNTALCDEVALFSGGSYADDILIMSITVK